MIPVLLVLNFLKIKLNALRGGIFILPMTCVNYLDSKDVLTSFLPPNSDHVMICLGGYNCVICQSNCNLPSDSPHDLNWMSYKDVNLLAKSIYCK